MSGSNPGDVANAACRKAIPGEKDGLSETTFTNDDTSALIAPEDQEPDSPPVNMRFYPHASVYFVSRWKRKERLDSLGL